MMWNRRDAFRDAVERDAAVRGPWRLVSPFSGLPGCVALAGMLLATLALGQARQPGGLFRAVAPAQVAADPGSRIASDSPTLRRRLVSIDFDQLSAARATVARGMSAMLTLNLFDDVGFSVVVDRLTPTESGYALSGRLDGVPFGTMTLVVNGAVVAGTVRSPAAMYAIRSAGSGAYLIREVDSSWLLDELEPPVPAWHNPGSQLGPLAPNLSPADRPVDRLAEDADDGSVVDVVVFYTPAARAAVGGVARMETLIDLFVSETNQAYRDSDVVQRIELVETEEVAYTEAYGNFYDLTRITNKEDGHVDEIHAIRDVYAADMVHLLMASQDCNGRAWIMTDVSHHFEEWAFSVSGTGCADLGGIVFAHELGHNMGLWHDRYAENSAGNLDSHGNHPYPYSYGYVNQRAFEPMAPTSSRWRTIMAQDDQCRSFSCPPLLRFSNADQRVNGDALGVPGDQASASVTGPADARRNLDNTRLTIANFRPSRDRTTCRYAVTPDEQIVPAAGGSFAVRVAARPGCAWTAESDDPFLSVVSGGSGAGPGTVTYSVEANGVLRRAGAILIADQTLTVHQIGPNTPGVCTRTPQVRKAIMRAAGRASCWEVSDPDLAGIFLLDLDDRGLTALPASDLAGLTGLTELRLAVNRLSALRRDTFAHMTNLEALSLAANQIAALPAGIFADLTRLHFLDLGLNQFTTIPVDIAGLVSLESLYLYDNPLISLPVGVFDDLSKLRLLWLQRTQLAALPSGIFAGLSELEVLRLQSNQLNTLPAGIFVGLANLENVSLELNPGEPFTITLQLARTEDATPVPALATLAVHVNEGAPFEMPVSVSATPASALSVQRAVLAPGTEQSDGITVTQVGALPVTVRLETPPPVPLGFWGMRTAVGPPLVLFNPSAPFTDDPIRPGVTPIKAIHFTELRSRIEGLREAAGLDRFAWTDPFLRAGVTLVSLAHLLELRSALAEVYGATGRAMPSWTDTTPVAGRTPIRALHLMELRDAVVAIE